MHKETGYDRKTKIAITCGLLLFALASAATIFEFSIIGFLKDPFGSNRKGPIGKAVVVEGDVYRRAATSLSFLQMHLADPIFDGDTVMVDEKLRLVLAFNDGSFLELGPKTLVKLSFLNDFTLGGSGRLMAEVLSGNVGGNGIQIVSAEKSMPLPLEQIVKPAPKPTPAPVVKPPPKPVEKPKPTLVKKAPPPPPPKPTVALVHPEKNMVIDRAYLTKNQETVLFTWKEFPSAGGYFIQVAKDADFRDVLFQRKVPRNFFPYRGIPTGNYFWKVKTDGEIQSDVLQFSVK